MSSDNSKRLVVANAAIETYNRQRSRSPSKPETRPIFQVANSALKKAKLEEFKNAKQLENARQKKCGELRKLPKLSKRVKVVNAVIKTYRKDRSRSTRQPSVRSQLDVANAALRKAKLAEYDDTKQLENARQYHVVSQTTSESSQGSVPEVVNSTLSWKAVWVATGAQWAYNDGRAGLEIGNDKLKTKFDWDRVDASDVEKAAFKEGYAAAETKKSVVSLGNVKHPREMDPRAKQLFQDAKPTTRRQRMV